MGEALQPGLAWDILSNPLGLWNLDSKSSGVGAWLLFAEDPPPPPPQKKRLLLTSATKEYYLTFFVWGVGGGGGWFLVNSSEFSFFRVLNPGFQDVGMESWAGDAGG